MQKSPNTYAAATHLLICIGAVLTKIPRGKTRRSNFMHLALHPSLQSQGTARSLCDSYCHSPIKSSMGVFTTQSLFVLREDSCVLLVAKKYAHLLLFLAFLSRESVFNYTRL
jgi:hypothetical protein